MHTWRPEVDVRYLSQLFSTLFIEIGSLADSDSLTSQSALDIPSLGLPRITGGALYLSGFHAGPRDLNCGPHTCPASTSSTDPPLLHNM